MSNSFPQRLRRVMFRLAWVFLVLVILLAGVAVYLDLHLYLRPVPHELDAAIQQQVQAAKLPGAAVAILKGNQVIFAQAYGFANIEEMRAATPDTLYQVASVSKLATATAVMRLYEQGSFQLDDDISQFLPFKVRNPRFPDRPITFRMLLAHTGSIDDGPAYAASYTLGRSEDPTEPLGEFLREYLTPNGRYYNPDKNFTQAEPGTKYAYSNVGFGLLGYLVERISGQPFDDYCTQEVFEPLGMPDTRWFNRDVDKSRMAMPYGYDMLRRTFAPLGYYGYPTYPDGMLKTSVNEFARFVYVFTNAGQAPDGTQFLRPESVQEMLRVQYPNSGEPVGFAWHMDADDHVYNHSGGDPGISSLAAISAEGRWGLIIFANGGGEQGLRSMLGFLALAKNLYPRVLEYVELADN